MYQRYYQIFSPDWAEEEKIRDISLISSKSERVYDSLIEEQVLTGLRTVGTTNYKIVAKVRKNLTTSNTVVDIWSTESGTYYSPYGFKTPLD